MYSSAKRLWPFVKPYQAMLVWAMVTGFLLAQISVVVPALIKALIEGFQGNKLVNDTTIMRAVDLLGVSQDHWVLNMEPQQLVTAVALCIPVQFLIFGILRFTHYYLVKYVGEQVIADIRVALMNKFMELDVLYLSRQQRGSGGILSRTLNDTLVLQQGLQYYVDLIREPITACFLISYMFFISWKMTLGCFLFLPIFAFVIRSISRSLKKFGHESQESLEQVTNTLKEGLDGVRVIQSFNLQGQMKLKFQQQVAHYLNRRKKIIKREEMGSPINEWFASLLVCGICLIQAQLIWSGESDVGNFISFLFAGGMLQKPIKQSQQAIIRIQQTVVAVERLDEVLSSQTQVKEPTEPKAFPSDWNQIEFKNVNFSYNNTPVLKNINLNIKKGEVVALIGESGSGKSTLAGLLQRFFDPTSGEILVGKTPISSVSTQDLRSQIGYVTQDVFLFNDTIESNIWFGNLERSPSEVAEAARMANASSFIEAIPDGMQSVVGERGGNLSGGEKQRISIARAVFKDPPLLILDEATSALDSASELEVQKGIDSLLSGRTALVIAHRLSTIINSDRIIVMKNGEIVEEGDHQSLLAKDSEYARFYKLQYQ